LVKIDTIIHRADVPRTFGDRAGRYLQYRFIALIGATYRIQDLDISIEIAQFADDTHAYGWYALDRPDGAEVVTLGAEGYVEGNSLYFTQNNIVVTLSSLDGMDRAGDAMRLLAVTVSSRIGPVHPLPAQFAFFPEANRISPSQKFIPRDFLNIPDLNDVFTVDYLIDADTLVLFLTEDSSGEKYIGTMQFATSIGGSMAPTIPMKFDSDYGLVLDHPPAGRVLVGLKNFRLIGASGYDPTRDGTFVKKWVDGFASMVLP
jgi:hypothetical protein